MTLEVESDLRASLGATIERAYEMGRAAGRGGPEPSRTMVFSLVVAAAVEAMATTRIHRRVAIGEARTEQMAKLARAEVLVSILHGASLPGFLAQSFGVGSLDGIDARRAVELARKDLVRRGRL